MPKCRYLPHIAGAIGKLPLFYELKHFRKAGAVYFGVVLAHKLFIVRGVKQADFAAVKANKAVERQPDYAARAAIRAGNISLRPLLVFYKAVEFQVGAEPAFPTLPVCGGAQIFAP